MKSLFITPPRARRFQFNTISLRSARSLVAAAALSLILAPAVIAPHSAPAAQAQVSHVGMNTQSGSINWGRDLSAAQQAARSNGMPIMISFGADWCPWCRRMDRDTFTNAGVINTSRAFNCVEVDTETARGRELSNRYSIESLPTVVFLNAQGNEVKRLEGFQEGPALLAAMNSVRPKGITWLTSLPQAQAESRRTGKPILLSFHADWCPWCRRLERDTLSAGSVTTMANDFIFVKVDTETAEGERLCQEYAVDSYPYLIFFNSSGSIVDTQEGFCSASDLASKMRRVL